MWLACAPRRSGRQLRAVAALPQDDTDDVAVQLCVYCRAMQMCLGPKPYGPAPGAAQMRMSAVTKPTITS